MSRLTITASTPLCLLQDSGRFGVRHLGVTQGGAADWCSMSWANWLLGNALDATVIEITLGGFALVAEEACCLALAGADLGAQIDGQPLAPWRSFNLDKGQILQLTQPLLGARAYLAAPGGFVAPKVLGSTATVLREELGGLDGMGLPLAKGATLEYHGLSRPTRGVPRQHQPDLRSRKPLDLVLGAQIGQFSGQSLFEVFNTVWTLDSRADRMGIRLLGKTLAYQGLPMISEGIPLGAVQVPPDGQPIVLLNDRQTIGGYPRLGALTPLALARLAQYLPGANLRFRPVLQGEAWKTHQNYLGSYL
ncbi:biotin-dependent carboxyltransferase [Pseudomonas granadensis]|uniref:Biotin-dependent carboxyltransferase n=1 Tax=Pseudomonas granadensis TaxID=1421430 RepID=A0ABX7GMU0_9PSED|nr:biotin-dependent carboxyltransferase family protein [Pseudomonas granadensis]MBN6773337.1 biotin-dependent carboxyltransferase [Pseudomonas granadensis]MBN6804640.1 biotin-dependent carboxyltransferase [Pseudomonas granadensis]MBN6831786.1 biotin-dependent carboxyltransferase [Pseudomonas granadensis]MBN6838411.1 biotin-dependent carboxyltransferase [Pseudomonas granadensis]MBN6866748.1 biotin-dependent carboxyltransferase [Pseudomonas granadensis]